MSNVPEGQPRVVLVGAGHAHLRVASQARHPGLRGAEVVLIAPDATWYSGMATGMLGGRYAPAEDRIDPGATAAEGGARFIDTRVTGLDRQQRAVCLESGETVPYDLVSFAVGSTIAPLDTPPAEAPAVWPVKPISDLARLRSTLEAHFRAGGRTRIAVVGGGATGCEVAANLRALARRHDHAARITIIEQGARLLPEAPPGAARALGRFLERRDVAVACDTPFEGLRAGALVAGGRTLPADHVVLATGLRPHPLVARLGLPSDPRDGLRVDACLRSIADPRIHAVGDCAAFEPRPLPKVGVFGVRQAPVLLHNLAAALDGRDPRPFRPQQRWLSILNLGDGHGLALYGRYWVLGRWPMRIKERLDRGFVTAFPAPAANAVAEAPRRESDTT